MTEERTGYLGFRIKPSLKIKLQSAAKDANTSTSRHVHKALEDIFEPKDGRESGKIHNPGNRGQ